MSTIPSPTITPLHDVDALWHALEAGDSIDVEIRDGSHIAGYVDDVGSQTFIVAGHDCDHVVHRSDVVSFSVDRDVPPVEHTHTVQIIDPCGAVLSEATTDPAAPSDRTGLALCIATLLVDNGATTAAERCAAKFITSRRTVSLCDLHAVHVSTTTAVAS